MVPGGALCVGVAVVPLTWREFDKFIISHRIWFGCVRFASRGKVRRPSCGDALARTPGIASFARGCAGYIPGGVCVRAVAHFVPGWQCLREVAN